MHLINQDSKFHHLHNTELQPKHLLLITIEYRQILVTNQAFHNQLIIMAIAH